tara:strand:+ start:301 stop:1170 length:870 start_codon:yes stop_codon:yes gene_type:complete
MPFDGSSFIRHVAERLVLEFNHAKGAGTPGLVGSAKEHPARVQLERLMPGGVAVGSGIVVDSYGAVSRQQDIVIYETLCPIFTHNDTAEATYYPVEGVLAVGEVKSGLGKSELADAVIKSVSVKTLRRHSIATDEGLGPPAVSYRNYGNGNSFSAIPANQFDQGHNSLDQIFSFVLCERFAASPQTTLQNFSDECKKVSIPLAPNMVVSLADGAIYPFNSKSGSIRRAMMEADGAIFSENPISGFAQLVAMLRLYAVSGRTVDREHYERYFLPIGGSPMTFPINQHIIF